MKNKNIMKESLMPRREFLKYSGIVSLGCLAPGTSLWANSNGQKLQTIPNWFDKPMRWANLTLVENDPGSFDPDFWLDYFRKTHVDAVCLSAGGYMAYYPTKIGLQQKSSWMKPGDDPFGKLVEGCRKQGLIVTARVDAHAVRTPVKEAHPDWIFVTAESDNRAHWENPDTWVTCALGPYNFVYMPQILTEIATNYPVEGIFANRWHSSGLCYCEHCQRQFKEATGYELPRSSEGIDMDRAIQPENEVLQAYYKWKGDRLFDVWDHWDNTIRKANPDSRFIPNMGLGLRHNILNMVRIGKRAEYLTADRQGRSGATPPWDVGIAAKTFRSVLGNKPIGGGFALGPHAQRWMDSVHENEEILIWAYAAIAHGLRPSYGKTNAQVYDTRWLKSVEELFTWHYQNERYLRDRTPIADVAVVFSQNTFNNYDPSPDSMNGIYQALVEARVPFEMLHEDQLTDQEKTAPFKTLILPNIAALSDENCSAIERFVENGGSVIASYETSLYNEKGIKRDNFALAKLFGADAGLRVGPAKSSYFRLDDKAQSPLLEGFEGAKQLVNTVYYNEVTLKKDSISRAQVPLKLIPSFPNLPMEELYARDMDSDQPLAIANEYGKGRVLYFAGDLCQTYWTYLIGDHGRLLINAVNWANQNSYPVEVEGPGMVEVTAWQGKDYLALHLVNYTNPMTMRGYYKEFIPVGPQKISFKLPDGFKPNNAKLLVSKEAVTFKTVGDRLHVTVPQLTSHEVLVLE